MGRQGLKSGKVHDTHHSSISLGASISLLSQCHHTLVMA
jgi:hypothetical protein